MRLGKYIGYGLTDVKCGDGGIEDPRINADSPLLHGLTPERDYLDLLDELERAGDEDAQMERMILREMMHSETSLAQPVTWDGEYGDPAVLVIRAAGFPHWARYSDAIDTEEYWTVHDKMEIVHRPLSGGVFPFTGLYMDARTGLKLDTTAASIFRKMHLSKKVSHDKISVMKKLAAALGFPDLAAAEEGVVPLVPQEIVRIARWGGLFAQEDAWRDLRPVFYGYWS